MRNSNSVESNFTPSGENCVLKNVQGRRSIRTDDFEISERKKLVLPKHEDRSISEPRNYSSSYVNNLPSTSSFLNTISENEDGKRKFDSSNMDDADDVGSEEDEEEENDSNLLSKSNSQLNESDLEIDATSSYAPTPTPIHNVHNTRRINSETNLNESQRRMSGFMGNRSKRFCASTSELSFASHLDTHKSLFSPKNNQNALSRQSFNSSLYGSNMSLSSNSRLFMANSPFYNGNTTFGGASAYPRRDINQHKILRNPVQMRPLSSLSNSSNNSATSDSTPLSNTAKRILEVMNQFSTPLKEARNMGNNINSILKIPSLVQNRQRFGEEELNFNRSIALSRPSAPYSMPLNQSKNRSQLSLNSSVVKPLQIPTMSQLLQMKRLQNNTERVRKIANKSESFLNNNQEYKLPSVTEEILAGVSSTTSNSSSYKIRNNMTKSLLRNEKNAGQDQIPALNLPNIRMPEMKSVPKFDIQLISDKVTTITTTSNKVSLRTAQPAIQFRHGSSLITKSTVKTNSLQSIKALNTVKSNNKFIFSKPIALDIYQMTNHPQLKSVQQMFVFSKPIKVNNETRKTNPSVTASTSLTASSDNIFKNFVAKQQVQWECDTCMTRNDSYSSKCLCCETPKQGTLPKLAMTENSFKSVSQLACDDLFKSLAAQQQKTNWECDSCMTQNDIKKEKCLCCETPQPECIVKKTSSVPVMTGSSSSFGIPHTKTEQDDLFKILAAKQKSAHWECGSCMTRNDTSQNNCLCCEAQKPSTTNRVAKTSSFSFGMQSSKQNSEQPKFSFGMSSENVKTSTSIDAGFKSLLDKQNANWECTACFTRNDQLKLKCVCCEQQKPGSATETTSQFSFGIKSSGIILPVAADVKFSFGIPAVTEIKDPVVHKPNKDSFGAVSNNIVHTLDIVAEKPITVSLLNNTSTAANPIFSFNTPVNDVSKENESKVVPEKSVDENSPAFKFGKHPTESDVVHESKSFDNPVIVEESDVKKTVSEAFLFGSNANSKTTSLNENSGFSFDSFTATSKTSTKSCLTTTTPQAMPSITTGFSFGFNSNPLGNKPTTSPIIFGNSSLNAEPPKSNVFVTSGSITMPAASTFKFGGTNKDSSDHSKTFCSYGISGSQEIAKTAKLPSFDNPQTNVFAQCSNNKSFSFSNSTKSDTPTSSASTTGAFTFGAQNKKSEPAPGNLMLFGPGNSQSALLSVTPVFGANTASATFGSFGATSGPINSINNNNECGFGSKMPSFGSPFDNTTNNAQQTNNQKPAFQFGISEDPAAKKLMPSFGFSSQSVHQPLQNQQLQQNTAPFQFGVQSGENKPSFNFSAAAPSFNFSNNATNNINVQQQPTNTPAPFQFGATTGPVQSGVQTFTSQSGNGAALTARRKIRANRRLPPR
ncbi:unnamed protein product [Diamesa hyperborea]